MKTINGNVQGTKNTNNTDNFLFISVTSILIVSQC